MEFVRSSDDFCAGYLQEDSDLEFSDCSEDVSSDEERRRARKRCGVPAVRPPRGGGVGGEWSEDEFERDMESELMCVLQTVTSPDALTAAVSPPGQIKGRSRKRRQLQAPRPESRPLSLEPSSSGGDKEGEERASVIREPKREKKREEERE
ncbi:hypothetical protein GBAR_LOCUS30456, partial [Geodia barretti]